MCQREILDFLKENSEKWWVLHEICCFNALDPRNCKKALKQLRHYNEVEYKIIPENNRIGHQLYMYHYKEYKEE